MYIYGFLLYTTGGESLCIDANENERCYDVDGTERCYDANETE